MPHVDDEESDRDAILLRRRRFLALALCTAAVGASGCESVAPTPCLSRIPSDGGPPDAESR